MRHKVSVTASLSRPGGAVGTAVCAAAESRDLFRDLTSVFYAPSQSLTFSRHTSITSSYSVLQCEGDVTELSSDNNVKVHDLIVRAGHSTAWWPCPYLMTAESTRINSKLSREMPCRVNHCTWAKGKGPVLKRCTEWHRGTATTKISLQASHLTSR